MKTREHSSCFTILQRYSTEDPLLIKDGLLLLTFMCVKKTIKSTVLR
jgi:hypothetical protein